MRENCRQAFGLADSPFRVSYEDAARAPALLKEKGLLALIAFGSAGAIEGIDDPRLVHVALPELGNANTVEVWRAPCEPETGDQSGIRYSKTDAVLFGCLQWEEARFPGMEQAAYQAYRNILACQQRLGYPYLLRTWNYLPDIHGEEAGLERYRAFCLGRHRILETTPYFDSHLVAATAMGTHASRMLIYFLAASEPGIRIENPRQVSAFRYPARYAPRSPSFARATLKPWGTETHLYISGTASIVGHETLHTGRPLAQLDEVLNNLQSLVENARYAHRFNIRDLTELSLLKVYVRQGVAVDSIVQHLQARLGSKIPPVLCLQGDICREELLVEIEAFHAGRVAAAGESA